jgi:hypothetical protein
VLIIRTLYGKGPIQLHKELGADAKDRTLGHLHHFIAAEVAQKYNLSSREISYSIPGTWARYIDNKKTGNPLIKDFLNY